MLTRVQPSNSRKYTWAAMYFLLGSGLPLLSFLIEFNNISSPSTKDSFEEYVIRIYSPLFLYACLVGFLIPYYIVPAYDFFKSSINTNKIEKLLRRFMAASIIVAVVVAFSDFFGGASAIWELRPPIKVSLVDHFMNADSATTDNAKIIYKEEIDKQLSKDVSNWSITRYAYFLSLIIEGFFLNVFFYLSIFYYSFRHTLNRKNHLEYNKHLFGLIISSFIIFIWLLLRLMNGSEKSFLYPGKDLQSSNLGIGLLNICCLLLLILASISNRQIQKISETIISFALSALVFFGSFFGYNNPKFIVDLFGRGASLLSYLVFPVVFILIFGALHIIAIGAKYESEPEPLNDQPPNQGI